MTIKDLKEQKLLLFEAIGGSYAYGLNHAASDRDIRGVFVMPQEDFYGLNYIEQVNDEKNDEVYYELKKFIQLLANNNPNFLEILQTPEDLILYKHPLFDRIKMDDFICRKAVKSFTGYAQTQIKKARGLNKKIVNPMEEERKGVLDFCFVQHVQGSILVMDYLQKQKLDQADCGLARIPHMKNCFGLYHDLDGLYNGIIGGETSNDISLSSIAKGEQPLTILYFNQEGYSVYCKEYHQYWEWVNKRNQSRYESTMNHGKQYDAKNMMHTFRLLHMAKEIALTGTFHLKRTGDKAFLWKIRKGEFDYDELVQMAEQLIKEINGLSSNAPIREQVDMSFVNRLLGEIRKDFYKG